MYIYVTYITCIYIYLYIYIYIYICNIYNIYVWLSGDVIVSAWRALEMQAFSRCVYTSSLRPLCTGSLRPHTLLAWRELEMQAFSRCVHTSSLRPHTLVA